MQLNQNANKAFQNWVVNFGHRHGRNDLPWRGNFNPYHVLVSELMLQQTQVERVIPLFERWIQLFPTVSAVAYASPSQIISAWQGLGYNRRGLYLKKTAEVITQDFEGVIPSELDQLLHLPGIGPYTAAAVRAFGFDLPGIVIETNIRTVFLYHFFPDQEKVADTELTPLIEASAQGLSPRLWYSTLMDYGSYLKKVLPNPSRKSRHHSKQSIFAGSRRQVRGFIIQWLSHTPKLSKESLLQAIHQNQYNPDWIDEAIWGLVKDGLIEYHQDKQLLTLYDK